VSSKQSNAINEAITKTASVEQDNEEIKKDLVEFERFYHVFHIANQFFNLPLPMPDPTEYGIEEAYYLSISIARWEDQDREIYKRLLKENANLTSIFQGIQKKVKKGPPPSADTQGTTGDDNGEP
jgi:hypothetical protein